MKFTANKLIVGMAIASALCGCDPDEIVVNMDVSDIVKAYNGEIAYAKAKISYSTMTMDADDEDDKAKLENCKAVAQKYVGKGGRVRITKGGLNDGISSEYNMPIYNSAKPQTFPTDTPLRLALTDDRKILMLQEDSDVINKLNADLKRATSSGDFDFSLNTISAEFVGITHFLINNDTEDVFSFTVVGAFVDDEPELLKAVCLKPGDECEIKFPRKKDEEHVYNKIWPRIFNLTIGSGEEASEKPKAKK